MTSPSRSVALVAAGAVFLLILVANAFVTVRSVRVLSEGFENAERPAEVERTLTELLASLLNAETGQRGYLLTGEASYLDPYRTAEAQTDSLLNRLDVLVSWNPVQVERMPALREGAHAKLAELAQVLRLRESESQEAAMLVVREGSGRREMEDLRAQIRTMEAEATRVRSLYAARVGRARQRAWLSILGTNGALALALVVLGFTLRRNLRAREEDARLLRETNGSLSEALASREAALSRVQAMQGQLVQQEKLASMGRLTAGVAHEIKNPLNFVNNFAQLSTELADEATEMLAEGDVEETTNLLGYLRQNAATILTHGQRADEIVQAMLIHARGIKGKREPADLKPIIDTAVKQALGPQPQTDVQILREDAPDVGEVPLVPSAVTRLLTNLVQNAIHAVRERGGAGDPGYAPVVRITSQRTEDREHQPVVTVTVEDNGAGIPDAMLPRIFEPFYTTKGPGHGTGLGLSLAHDIAVGHGGSLLAGRSALGGAQFTLSLPLDVADADLPEITRLESPPASEASVSE